MIKFFIYFCLLFFTTRMPGVALQVPVTPPSVVLNWLGGSSNIDSATAQKVNSDLFPLELTDEQIRTCSAQNTKSKGGDCMIHINNKKYSPRYLCLSYFIRLLRKKVVLKGRLQEEKIRSNTGRYLVYPTTDEKGNVLPEKESMQQSVNLILKIIN